MTPPDVPAQYEKARAKLDAARKNLEMDLVEDSISRAYYAMYHAALALLATKGERPRTHGGVMTRFHLHFVKPGLFPVPLADAFARAKDFREYADYETGSWLDEAEAARLIEEAGRFLEAAREALGPGGGVK